MPKIDGFEFIDRLQNDELYSDIPIMVMSSLSKDSAMKKLKKYRLEAYMQKDTFNQTQLIDSVKDTLTKLHEYATDNYSHLFKQLENEKQISKELEDAFKKCIENFFEIYQQEN